MESGADLRERAGVTQLALAESLGNTQTFISKIERGERRIDVVEFIEICDALGADPAPLFANTSSVVLYWEREEAS